MTDNFANSRRRFLRQSAFLGGVMLGGLPSLLRAQQAPVIICADSSRPCPSHGLMIGDVVA